MKAIWLGVMLALLASPVLAKSCEALKQELDAKIHSHGVKAFTLEIVAKGEAGGLRVVGSCERGAKQITYRRD